MKKQNHHLLLVVLLVMATAFFRVVNAEFHFYNMVPVAALGLFSGSLLKDKRAAYLIPLMAMFLSDIGLATFTNVPGFYGISQLVNYGALALVTLMGTFLVKRNAMNIAGFTISGSLVFFILSNFGTFLSGFYGFTYQGFIECFTMALPFYKSEIANTFFLNSVLGDLVFSAIAFGLAYLAEYKKPRVKVT